MAKTITIIQYPTYINVIDENFNKVTLTKSEYDKDAEWEINWSAFGAVSVIVAEQYMHLMTIAANVAFELNTTEKFTTPKDCNLIIK